MSAKGTDLNMVETVVERFRSAPLVRPTPYSERRVLEIVFSESERDALLDLLDSALSPDPEKAQSA